MSDAESKLMYLRTLLDPYKGKEFIGTTKETCISLLEIIRYITEEKNNE